MGLTLASEGGNYPVRFRNVPTHPAARSYSVLSTAASEVRERA